MNRALLALALLAACGERPVAGGPPSDDTCDCDPGSNLTCDLAGDRVCRCAGAQCKLGQICDEGEGGGLTCQSALCASCPRGTSCTAPYIACTCGAGPACPEGAWCQEGACIRVGLCDGVVCLGAAACDPADGRCHCGSVECAQGEDCTEPGLCTFDPCSGVACPGGGVCNPDDRQCHCGSEVGPICNAGETCSAGECAVLTVCTHVTCSPGMVCDPNPEPGMGGFCRCGGIGPEFPRCPNDATCDLDSGPKPRCAGVEYCPGVDCKEFPGSYCDPEDGIRKCGGLDGFLCEAGEGCAGEAGTWFCAALCDPLDPICSEGQACYYDLAKRAALCGTAGRAAPDEPCTVPADCAPGTFCSGFDHLCREACSTGAPAGEPNGCPDSKSCSPMPNRLPKYADLGQCLAN